MANDSSGRRAGDWTHKAQRSREQANAIIKELLARGACAHVALRVAGGGEGGREHRDRRAGGGLVLPVVGGSGEHGGLRGRAWTAFGPKRIHTRGLLKKIGLSNLT